MKKISKHIFIVLLILYIILSVFECAGAFNYAATSGEGIYYVAGIAIVGSITLAFRELYRITGWKIDKETNQ